MKTPLVGLIWVVSIPTAAQNDDAHAAPDVGAATAPAPASSLEQKTCPVTGKPATKEHFLDFRGLTIHFCSAACIEKFRDAPGEYLPIVYRQIHPQQVQVRCPVTGAAIDGTTHVEHAGRRIGFCGPACAAKFQADPGRYLTRLLDCMTDQVHCPVTGKPINPAFHTEYGGRTVYFCGKECIARLKSAPAKYADALRPEVGMLARGATAGDDLVLCPVCAMGGGGQHKRRQSTTVVHKGKTYFFCCEHCAARFKSSPDTYARAMEERAKRADAERRDRPGNGTP